MFEDLHRTHPVRLANNKRNRLQLLLAHDASLRLINDLELRTGQQIPLKKKHHLLRRLQEETKKRPLQDETYEQWHYKREASESERNEEQKKSKRKRKAAPPTVSHEDFDEHLREVLIEELAKEEDGADRANSSEPASQSIPENEANLASSSESDESSSNSDTDTEQLSNEEEQSEGDFDMDDSQDIQYALRTFEQWKNSFDTLRTWARDKYQLKLLGLEYMGESDENVSASIVKQHLQSLTALLHINILRHKWSLAYKILCLVVRFDVVDLRALWPLAIEILTRRKEELRASGSFLKLDLLKEHQFLEWIALSFPVSHNPVHSSYPFLGPVFRLSTRTYAPIYVLTMLWMLLVERKYSRLRDSLTDLILQPPYSTDGVFFYILALCNIAESIHLVSCLVNFDTCDISTENDEIGDLAEDMMLMGSEDTMKARIANNIKASKTLLETCQKLDFEFPKEFLYRELENVSLVLDGELDISSLQMKFRNAPPHHERAGYTFHNSQVQASVGPNILSGKHLKKLIVGLKSIKEPSRSWIWDWIELKEDGPTVCKCSICGQDLQKPRNSSKRVVEHLAEHNITSSTLPRLSETSIQRHKQIMDELIATQDEPRCDVDRKFTFRLKTQTNSFRRDVERVDIVIPAESLNSGPPFHRNSNEARARRLLSDLEPLHGGGNLLANVNSMRVPLQLESRKQLTSSNKWDISNTESGDAEVTQDAERTSYSSAGGIGLSEEDANKDVSYQEGNEQFDFLIADAEQDIFNELNEAASQVEPQQEIRRYESFSPNTTMDTEYEGEISRNFHQFSTQTQETNIRGTAKANLLTIDDSANIYLNSFNLDQDSKAGITNGNSAMRNDDGMLTETSLAENENILSTLDDVYPQGKVKKEDGEESSESDIFDDARESFDDLLQNYKTR